MRLHSRLIGVALAGLVLSSCGVSASGGGPQPLNPLSRWHGTVCVIILRDHPLRMVFSRTLDKILFWYTLHAT